MELKLTQNQLYVIKAISELRYKKGHIKLENQWVEERTILLKRQAGEKKDGKVARQQWTAPFGDSDTEKTWELIGEAVRGRLPRNSAIEVKIRECKSADTALVAELKDQITLLETRIEGADAAKYTAITEFNEFKSKYYSELCTDAHYRINFRKVLNDNKNLVESAKHDSETIQGLTCQVNAYCRQVAELEAMISDGDRKLPLGVEPINRPQVFEPKLVGRDENLENDGLLRMYEKAIEGKLEDLSALAKEGTSDIIIVFHDFNIDIRDLVVSGKIPLRSARRNNIIFACHGASPEVRISIYQRLAVLSVSPPMVVVLCGKGKIDHFPVRERKGMDNHNWFVALIRTKAFRSRPINGENEGYDTVVYRRLDDGN